LNYLWKLDEIAKLEPCGMYHVEPASPGSGDGTTHVVARTPGANRKYFYRRRDNGSWTPWEHITLDIEDNPVVPVVWDGRLFLFWLRLLQEGPVDPSAIAVSSPDTQDDPNLTQVSLSDVKGRARQDARNNRVAVKALLCWSEHYNEKWQPPRTSDLNHPADLGWFAPSGSGSFNRTTRRLWATPDPGALGIYVLGASSPGPFVPVNTYLLYNTHSTPQLHTTAHYRGDPSSLVGIDGTHLTEFYYISDPDVFLPYVEKRHILTNVNAALESQVTRTMHSMSNHRYAPFFYFNAHHAFYIVKHDTPTTLADVNHYISSKGINIEDLQIPSIVLNHNLVDLHLVTSSNGVSSSLVDLSDIAKLIEADPRIDLGINVVGGIPFGESLIGLSGRLNRP
jgi:hypothetical protein